MTRSWYDSEKLEIQKEIAISIIVSTKVHVTI